MSISISSSTPVQNSPTSNPVDATKKATRGDKDVRQGSEVEPDNTRKQANAPQAFTNALGQLTGTQLSVKA